LETVFGKEIVNGVSSEAASRSGARHFLAGTKSELPKSIIKASEEMSAVCGGGGTTDMQ
jgi:hypothetical protein